MSVLLDPSARLVIAHRGNSAHAPENTIESFAQAVSLGADALELDVRLSADGVAVVIHDATVDRTTDSQGAVSAMTLAELRALDAGARWTRDGGRSFPYRGRAIRIPMLEEVLRAFPDMPLVIEVKTADVAGETRRVLEAFGAAGRVVVGSFLAAAMRPFHDSPIPFGASREDVARLVPLAWAGLRPARLPYRLLSVPLRHGALPLPVVRMARSVRRAGCVTHVWVVNEPALARRLWRGGVAGIVTDDPELMLSARDG